jgi:uridine monophosphate synthetase
MSKKPMDPGVAYVRRCRALDLFDAKAVLFGAFKLAIHEQEPNRPLSPIFFNLRTADNLKNGQPGPLTPTLVSEIGLTLWSEACQRELEFDWICGLPKAGEPFAAAMSERFDRTNRPKPVLKLLKEEVDGKRTMARILTGGWKPGDRVLVVDDLITQATVKRLGIETLRQAGLKVTDCLVLIDREQGGTTELAQRDGVQVHACYTLTELLHTYVTENRITQAKADEVERYRKEDQARSAPPLPAT